MSMSLQTSASVSAIEAGNPVNGRVLSVDFCRHRMTTRGFLKAEIMLQQPALVTTLINRNSDTYDADTDNNDKNPFHINNMVLVRPFYKRGGSSC